MTDARILVYRNAEGAVHKVEWHHDSPPTWRELSDFREQYGALIFERQFRKEVEARFDKVHQALFPIMNKLEQNIEAYTGFDIAKKVDAALKRT
jgi:hypothetical protein